MAANEDFFRAERDGSGETLLRADDLPCTKMNFTSQKREIYCTKRKFLTQKGDDLAADKDVVRAGRAGSGETLLRADDLPCTKMNFTKQKGENCYTKRKKSTQKGDDLAADEDFFRAEREGSGEALLRADDLPWLSKSSN